MCDCEDFVPAQELKGTSLPSPVVDSSDKKDTKQRSENLFLISKKCMVSTLENCALKNCHITLFAFLPQNVLQLFLPKKSKAEMFNEQSSYFKFLFRL